MKNKFFHFAGVFSFCVLLFAFNSCSDVRTSNDEKGSVSFVIDGGALRSAFESGRAVSITSSARAGTIDDDSSSSGSDYTGGGIELTIALCGDYSASKTVALNGNVQKATVSFDNIPVGRAVTAVAYVNMKESYDGYTSSRLEFFGASEPKKISSGTNSLSFNLKNANIYSDEETYYGKASNREKYPAQFILNIGEEKSGTGVWSITYWPYSYTSPEEASAYGGTVSLGAYKVNSRNSDNNPVSVSITEYVYMDSNGAYQFVRNPTTTTVNLASSSLSINLAQIGAISFGESAISEYNLNVHYKADGEYNDDYTLFQSIYEKSGTVNWEYGTELVFNYSEAVKEAFEAVGYTYRYYGFSSSPNTGVADVDVYFYGERDYQYTSAGAFFPTGYEGKTVKEWYSRTKADANGGTKTLAVFLFEDGTFVQTKHKANGEGEVTEKTIEATGSYTLNDGTGTMTSDQYKVGGQAITCGLDIILGDVLVQNFTEYYGKTLDGEEEPWQEAIECFIKRTDSVPTASEPTE